jgi:hypothetical protein
MSGFIQNEPSQGEPATERTEVWLFFDGDNLYVSARCWDSDPDSIISTELRRDNNTIYNGNDIVAVALDHLPRRVAIPCSSPSTRAVPAGRAGHERAASTTATGIPSGR